MQIEVERVEYLLKQKADKDLKSSTGYSPLHTLCTMIQNDSLVDYKSVKPECDTKDLIKTLLDYSDDINKSTGLTSLTNSLIDASADDLDTPLHIASKKNTIALIPFLVDNNADLNKKNVHGYTPLHYSCLYGHYEICSILLENGAKINKASNNGSTPLHQAILNTGSNSKKIVSLLVDSGADINKEDVDHITPLAMAIMNGNYSVCNFLIGKKARVLNSHNETITFTCALNNKADLKCLQMLVDKHNFDELFSHSLTSLRNPLQLCVEKRSNDFLKTLLNCDNIACYQWLNKLHSKCAFGVSPVVMVLKFINIAIRAIFIPIR
jgi:ankyrin repeat protein